MLRLEVQYRTSVRQRRKIDPTTSSRHSCPSDINTGDWRTRSDSREMWDEANSDPLVRVLLGKRANNPLGYSLMHRTERLSGRGCRSFQPKTHCCSSFSHEEDEQKRQDIKWKSWADPTLSVGVHRVLQPLVSKPRVPHSCSFTEAEPKISTKYLDSPSAQQLG